MSDFYDRLDEHERKSRIDRLIANRPENLHDYQGCANDAAKQSASDAQPFSCPRGSSHCAAHQECRDPGECSATPKAEAHPVGQETGWCSSCDAIEDCARPKCSKCGDWLIFAAHEVEAQREEEPLPRPDHIREQSGTVRRLDSRIYRTINGKQYMRWEYAGGPDQCMHGYAKCFSCPECDEVSIPPPSDMPEPLVSDEEIALCGFGKTDCGCPVCRLFRENQQWRKFGASLKGVK